MIPPLPFTNAKSGFFTWRSLARQSGLKQPAVVQAMVQAIEGAD